MLAVHDPKHPTWMHKDAKITQLDSVVLFTEKA